MGNESVTYLEWKRRDTLCPRYHKH